MKMNIKEMMFSLPAVALVLSSGSGYGQNLLINGDFEMPLSSGTYTAPASSSGGTLYHAAQYWDSASSYPGWVSQEAAGSAAQYDWLRHMVSPSTSSWLLTSQNVSAFSNSAFSGGDFAGGIRVVPINADGNHIIKQMCQSVTDLSGDYSFEGVFAVPSTTTTIGAEAVVSYSTYSAGVLVTSGVVGTLNDQQTMEFSQTISQAVGAFDSIEVCYSIESLDAGSSMIVVDGFSLTAVPEPTSTLLLGLGSLGLITRRRR